MGIIVRLEQYALNPRTTRLTVYLPSSVDCGNGYYCAEETTCDKIIGVTISMSCIPSGSLACGGPYDYYCPAGTQCNQSSGGQTVCNPVTQKYSCSGSSCIADPNGSYTSFNCNNTCSEGGGSTCSNDSACANFGASCCSGSSNAFCESDHLCHCCEVVCGGTSGRCYCNPSCLSSSNCPNIGDICWEGKCTFSLGGAPNNLSCQ